MNPALKGLIQIIFVCFVYGCMLLAVFLVGHPANQPEDEE